MYPVTVASDVSLGGLQVTEMAVGLIISARTLVGVPVTIIIVVECIIKMDREVYMSYIVIKLL